MKFLLFLSTLFAFGTTLCGQKADLEYVLSAIEIRFSIELDTVNLCETYIINGIVFDEQDFENKLKTYKKSKVKLTAIADLSNSTFHHKNCDYMVIIGAGNIKQPKETKQKELDSIRTNLNRNLPKVAIRDFICEQCKQVVVDGTPLNIFKAQTFVNDLKVEDIDYIVSYESANPMVFGRNSVNGLTEIFLKKKADNKR